MTARILIVDDESNIRRMLAALLRAEGFDVAEAPGGNQALLALDDVAPDLVLLDLVMPPGPGGLETLEQLKTREPGLPVIMMSGKAQLNDAVRAIKVGAFQFLEKPLTPEAVLVTIKSALELTRAQAEARVLRSQLAPRAQMVGTSPPMQRVRELITQVAPTDARVLILGESGTGKELVATAVHRASRRATKSFVTVNCAAIPRDLVESELFGHERGAFTGATDRRLGRFELAHGGTIFLDEVGDLSLEAQAKLLRVLESGDVTRLGSERTIRVDVRVLAATNQRLEQAVAAGSFREDLFFRLNVFPIELAPLRARLTDLPELVRHLTLRVIPQAPPQFTTEAMELLSAYTWPGNIRELANIVERLTILGAGEIDAAAVRAVLPRLADGKGPGPAKGNGGDDPFDRSLSNLLDDYERSLISRALTRAGGNVAEAARLLQTDRANLYRRMKRLGLS